MIRKTNAKNKVKYLVIISALLQSYLFTAPSSGSLQSMINSAQPGSTINVPDGVYYEQLVINKPLILRAENGGKAVITGQYQQSVTWTAETGQPGLYSVQIPWQVKWVMHADRNLIDYKTLQRLTAFSMDAPQIAGGSYPGPHEGFAYENGKLYIILKNKANPNNETVRFNDDNDGYGISISSPDVTIDGFEIRLWHQAGVYIDAYSWDNTVSDCFFQGCFRGILGWGGYNRKNLTVINNEFSGKPIYEIRQSDSSVYMWRALYDQNIAVRFLKTNQNGLIARHNYVYEVFDGLECKGDNGTTTYDTEISYNVVSNAVDNPLEFDSAERNMKARVHHNFVFDSYTFVSVAPFQSGEILIDHCIFYCSPEQGPAFCRLLKTCYHEYADPNIPQKNVTFAHNTAVLGDSDFQSSSLYTPCACGNGYSFLNYTIENNIFCVKDVEPCQLNGVNWSQYNLIFGSDIYPGDFTQMMHSPPGLAMSAPAIDFHLDDDSNSISAAVNKDTQYHHTTLDGSTDLGAIEYGDLWTFPKPGPSWADANHIQNRPQIPYSLNPMWIGFANEQKQCGKIQIYTTDDSYVRAGTYADYNYGSETLLEVKNLGNSNSFTRKAWLKFNLSEISGNIKRALLALYPIQGSSSSGHTLHSATDDLWYEPHITWNNKPDANSQPLATFYPSGGTLSKIDVTDYVENELTADNFATIMIDSLDSSFVKYASGEYSNISHRPHLEIYLGPVEDIDTSCSIDFRDIAVFAEQWLTENGYREANLNDDDFVNFIDWSIFAEKW